MLGAVDRGYRVVVATDALCSSSDEAHDASMTVYATRWAAGRDGLMEEILRAWSQFWGCIMLRAGSSAKFSSMRW